MKKLSLSLNDKRIAGVCSGLAEYFGLPAAAVRIFFIALFLLWGTGMVVYALLWAVLPVKKHGGDETDK